MKYTALLKKVFIVAFLFCVSNNVFSQLNPLTVGTISPGDSIVIYYDVTINTGCGCTQISNQGSVSGANFITLVTDDPDTGPAADPTISPLLTPLAVHLLELNATPKTGGIEVSWKVSNEENMIRYEVERSADGITFTKIGQVNALNSTSDTRYTFFDANPNSGVNFYRLRQIDRASFKYSFIVKANMDGKNTEIKMYPNPVTQQTIILQLTNIPKADYDLLFYNMLGQVVYKRTISHIGGSSSLNIALPASIIKGVYSVQLKGDVTLYNQMVLVK